MVTLKVAVLDVVVDEREVVDQLDCGGGREGLLRRAARGFAGEHAERRPEPLALAQRRWPAGLVDAAHVVAQHDPQVRVFRAQQLVYDPLHAVQVAAEYGWCVVGVAALSRHGSSLP